MNNIGYCSHEGFTKELIERNRNYGTLVLSEHTRTAIKAGVPMIVSAASNRTLEEIASVAAATINDTSTALTDPVLWFQIKIFKDQSKTLNLIRRVEKSGYGALVIGVDWSISGKRRETWNRLLQVCDPALIKTPSIPETEREESKIVVVVRLAVHYAACSMPRTHHGHYNHNFRTIHVAQLA
uniref:FMN-dependent dehydrogenase domain-containing protein n=1 Tax=Romanomermis culicivorax TaxID=13658 RepID=A0A915KQS4_ROMCU